MGFKKARTSMCGWQRISFVKNLCGAYNIAFVGQSNASKLDETNT
jgi:hypothetical protein